MLLLQQTMARRNAILKYDMSHLIFQIWQYISVV